MASHEAVWAIGQAGDATGRLLSRSCLRDWAVGVSKSLNSRWNLPQDGGRSVSLSFLQLLQRCVRHWRTENPLDALLRAFRFNFRFLASRKVVIALCSAALLAVDFLAFSGRSTGSGYCLHISVVAAALLLLECSRLKYLL